MSQYDGNGNQTSRYNGQDPMTHYTYDAADKRTCQLDQSPELPQAALHGPKVPFFGEKAKI